MWEVSGLFENLGTVQDGMNTLAQPIAVKDKPKANALEVSGGGIDFKRVNFSYSGRTINLSMYSPT